MTVLSDEKLNSGSIYKYAYDHNILASVTIELTKNCNWKCKHCYIPNKTTNHQINYSDMSQLFCDLRKMGTLDLVFTGGEIFTRSDTFEIIKRARELNFRVTLLSNASLLTEEKIELISSLNISQFSTTIFSLDKRVHDSITGVKDSFSNCFNNVLLMRKYNIPVQIKTPIMTMNKQSYKALMEFCDENQISYGASPIIFSRTNGDCSPHRLRLSKDGIKETIVDLDKINRFAPTAFEQEKEPCPALRYSLFIDSDGEVYPCNSFYYSVGNITREEIGYIWNDSEKLKNVKSIKNTHLSKCISCEVVEYCNRCPGLAYLEDDDMLGCSSIAREIACCRHEAYH
ncbi:radical SAM protein [Gorillibacterium sp. CAU 1737]|uniref:radical SAM/SPASM domain-containing protein n=1 Tax=Gorillibacterium sp. CAU 1737 TaxID=3140362 RepID=UPI003261BA4A